jgi:hypothetical protein
MLPWITYDKLEETPEVSLLVIKYHKIELSQQITYDKLEETPEQFQTLPELFRTTSLNHIP